MTPAELTEILLHEHKRDLRLTYIWYILILVFALAIVGLIGWLIIATGGSVGAAVDSMVGDTVDSINGNKYAIYYKLVIPFALLMGIGYFIFSLVKLHKRPKRIEEFVKLISNGTRTVKVDTTKEYKLKLPLLVVNLHTSPVSSIHVLFQNNNKLYSLPVPHSYVEHVKEILAENS